ncbi:hypothetical protein CO180_03400 [candidate division WWE3 bacterium CG_4_9_14_3_um_filter_41_6]|uniref:Uncharacterized protein n=1 Tax=candidate division WWE3 bacterium CG_4_10_14_0_2_um_filter_41_14 TaxID=1975072 RepID=A0A2M7TIJ3_UNCKA|nr:MAG: hypothetical protein COY32_03805 [candidate division WWE3 bacterium CG_4_10_14_0_2_um_filter_41_14]PJA38505.1 MAG: hypothetical protein CO180_03400 [candidate division WWE3 bacterium CG_4_9_14_3_um_filter_41_6]
MHPVVGSDYPNGSTVEVGLGVDVGIDGVAVGVGEGVEVWVGVGVIVGSSRAAPISGPTIAPDVNAASQAAWGYSISVPTWNAN